MGHRRHGRYATVVSGLVFGLVISFGFLTAAAQLGGDLQAQIVYAYQTEDVNELLGVIQGLRNQLAARTPGPDLRYQLAHADYRLAQLEEPQRPGAAEAALSDCVDELKPVLDADPTFVEGLALQSLCYEALAGHRKLAAKLLRLRAAGRLDAAYRLEPANPRVLLIRAERGLAKAKSGSAEARAAFADLKLAAEGFDHSSGTRDDAPGWGHAEAYLLLGREYLLQGNFLAARNWIERALIAAPDYKAAQRELAAWQSR